MNVGRFKWKKKRISSLFRLRSKSDSLLCQQDHQVPSPPQIVRKMRLYITPTCFVFISLNDASLVLVMDFCTGQWQTSHDANIDVNNARQFDVYGILGTIDLFSGTYVLLIIKRHLVGKIYDHDVYRLDNIAILPLDATRAAELMDVLKARRASMDVRPGESSSGSSTVDTSDEADDEEQQQQQVDPSKEHEQQQQQQHVGDYTDDEEQEENLAQAAAGFMKQVQSAIVDLAKWSPSDTVKMAELETKVLREMHGIFTRGGMFYSYTFDLTRRFQKNATDMFDDKNKEYLPMYQRVDRRFWWNEALLGGMVALQLDAWMVPIMQGYVQIEKCVIEEQAFDFILISRRSKERAGMRYQRRGINEQGAVANFVETEQVVVVNRHGTLHTTSLLQTRGSIPLFWTQNALRLRPNPQLLRTEEENFAAFSNHVFDQTERYGDQVCINLVEQEGREAIIGSEYRKVAQRMASNNPHYRYMEFDFHEECKGMKYENLSRLIAQLEADFAHIESYWAGSTGTVYCMQNGVFRTNCMDCLDRTNVVQSAIARTVLNLQLMRLGVQFFPEVGISVYEDFEVAFNDAWANNGDAISREYAGTSALKGDFTRTGKRNIQGVVNDATNSIARLYQNAFRDMFRQAAIDFLLGNHQLDIFEHVQETNQAVEPGDQDRWAKIRSNAIDITKSIVLSDEETCLNGWTLLTPTKPNVKHGVPYEECILLLTRTSLYICSFHYQLEKVVQFKRIALYTLERIQKGTYIISVNKPQHMHPQDNYGLIITYRPEGADMRFNSGSLRNSRMLTSFLSNLRSTTSVFQAFKAVPLTMVGEANKSSGMGIKRDGEPTCQDVVEKIVAEIAAAVANIGLRLPNLVVEEAIVTVEEVKSKQSIIEKLGNKIKPFLQGDPKANKRSSSLVHYNDMVPGSNGSSSNGPPIVRTSVEKENE